MRKFFFIYRSRWIFLKNICLRTRINIRYRITRFGLNIEFCYFLFQEFYVVIILFVCEYIRFFYSKEYMYQDLLGFMVGVIRSYSQGRMFIVLQEGGLYMYRSVGIKLLQEVLLQEFNYNFIIVIRKYLVLIKVRYVSGIWLVWVGFFFFMCVCKKK